MKKLCKANSKSKLRSFWYRRGGLLFSRQEKGRLAVLDMLIKIAASRSKSQMKALVQTILPRIALH